MTRKPKLFSNKRAITPVLSNLLLTIVAVAAMSLATTATYIITTNLRETMSERIIIEDVWFNNATSSIDVYLRNVGKIAVHVSTIYLKHDNRVVQYTPLFTLEKGSHEWLNIPQPWVSGDLYYLKIVTSRGGYVESYYEAP